MAARENFIDLLIVSTASGATKSFRSIDCNRFSGKGTGPPVLNLPQRPGAHIREAMMMDAMAEFARKIEQLEKRIAELEQRDRIFEKAFRVIGLHTNFAEFGAYKGDSLIQAFYSARKVCDELLGGKWDHSFTDPDGTAAAVMRHWEGLRFFAFDSFQGIPPPGVWTNR